MAGPLRSMLERLERTSHATGLTMYQIADVMDAMAEAEPDAEPDEATVENVVHWLAVQGNLVRH